jgi:hypothetical protein
VRRAKQSIGHRSRACPLIRDRNLHALDTEDIFLGHSEIWLPKQNIVCPQYIRLRCSASGPHRFGTVRHSSGVWRVSPTQPSLTTMRTTSAASMQIVASGTLLPISIWVLTMLLAIFETCLSSASPRSVRQWMTCPSMTPSLDGALYPYFWGEAVQVQLVSGCYSCVTES